MKPNRTVVEAARGCPLLIRARALAAFVDAGRPVTAKAVLRHLMECGATDPTTRTVTPLGIWARPECDGPHSPVNWADDNTLELRIDLDRCRPPVRRRVRLSADTTLTELHEIIQVLFEWDGDHLHVFTVDGMHYSDPLDKLDGCADSDQLSLAAAYPRPAPAPAAQLCSSIKRRRYRVAMSTR